ncbi:MAG: cupredoxin domain-containing protein [Dehalococcoidia bacterium]
MAKRLILPLIAGLILTAGLAACGSDDDADTATSTQSTPAVTSSAGDSSAAAAPTTAAAAATAAPTTVAESTAAAPAGPQALNIKAGEYFYDPQDLRVKPGTVALTMTNDGPERPHTFVVKNKSGDGDLFKSERVPVGGPVTLEFTVMEEGTYEVYCNLPGHADRGQRGTLTVSRI